MQLADLTSLKKAYRAQSSGFSLDPQRSETTEATQAREQTEEVHPAETFDEDYLEFPEGGVRAYLTVFGSFMGLIPVFGMINSVGALQAYVSTNQLKDVGTSTVSWIFSIYTFIAYSSGIFSGTFFDRCGAFKPMAIGSVALCSGILATANAKTVYQFILAFGVVAGFGTGMLISPLISAVSHFFYRRRATATSIATMGGSVGGIVIPMMLRKMYDTIGFAWALRVLALFCFCCLACSLVFTRERFRQDGDFKIDSFKKLWQVYVHDVFDYNSLFELKFMSCAFAIALAECSLVVVLVYFPSYAIMRGFGEHTAFQLIIVYNASSIPGRYLPGLAADHLGRFNVVILTISLCALTSLVMWLPFGHILPVLYAFAVIYGFFSGSILSLSPVCCGQISRTEEFGKRYSTMYLIVSLTTLGLIPVAGAIIGEGTAERYSAFIGFSVALLAAGIVCYIICRHACVGWGWRKF